MTTEEKGKYPVINTKQCPVCGSQRRMADDVTQTQIAEGRLPLGQMGFLFQHQSLIVQPGKAWLSAPLITSYFDACLDCGTVYCFHAQVQKVVQGGKDMPKHGPGQLPGDELRAN